MSKIQELSNTEMEQASGGIIPALIVGYIIRRVVISVGVAAILGSKEAGGSSTGKHAY